MEEKKLTLADMPTQTRCVIVKVHGHGQFRHRILEMGFVKGEAVQVVKNAPLMDPVEYCVMGSHVSLRRAEAENIEVVSLEEGAHPDKNPFLGTIEEHVSREVEEIGRQITVALVGNPNCGKTSFFNFATGLREKVGNYSGVTVQEKTAKVFHKGYTIKIVDLPGTYSLTEFSPEEIHVRNFLFKEQPDIVLNIVDAGNLERNLFLSTQLIDQDQPMVLALNMYDELEKTGGKLDHESLSKMLGFPIVPVVAKSGKGIPEVLDEIIKVYENGNSSTKHIHINYGEMVEKAISEISALVKKNSSIRRIYHIRYLALKLIEGDRITLDELAYLENFQEIKTAAKSWREKIENEYHDEIASVISDLKYGFIRGALSEVLTHGQESRRQLSYALDTVLTNRLLGFPVLLLFMWVMFWCTFTLGGFPQGWIEEGVTWLADWVSEAMPEGMLRDLLSDGIISGVGGVLVFLPNILILFLFISVLEDTGYMARAAFIMDKLMHRIGLHGKSFIPYIIGFGCGVPAIMATRTLENRKDRILTILTVPFMSCSARLPVYLLFVSAFFEKSQALILLLIYLIGIGVAIFTATILNKIVFKNASDQFVMELPPYRLPTLRNTLIHMWEKSAQYLKKMGSVILLASIIIWALGYFPRHENPAENTIENSYIGIIGSAIAPTVAPLGFDWQMGVSLLTGLAAKEIVVSSLSVIYTGDDSAETLPDRLRTLSADDGEPFFTPLKAFCFMLFILLYMPCIAAVVAIRRESGRGWMWFSIFYTIGVAWLLTFAVWQIGNLF